VRITVRLYAMLRERAGSNSVEIELEDGATVEDAMAALAQDPSVGDLAARLPLRIAVNREYAPPGATITAGDELAAIPPVSGGAERMRGARVTQEPLDVGAVTALVGDPEAGAVVTFQGTTRDVDRLEYEAYAEMAEPRIAEILRDCVDKYGLKAAAAEHRVGEVPLGQPSVVVAVSGAHREETFAGAREAIDRIKAEAPIWKKEIAGDEETWVEGTVP
jgi:molybdopterin converting factor subunit 1